MTNWSIFQNFTQLLFYKYWLISLIKISFVIFVFFRGSGGLTKQMNFTNLIEFLFFRIIIGMCVFLFLSLPLFLTNLFYLPLILFIMGGLIIYDMFLEGGIQRMKSEFLQLKAILHILFPILIPAIFISFICLLPPYRFDEVSYHLAYISKFANAHGICIDMGMRYPLYTFNWHVIQTSIYLIGGPNLCHFLTWFSTILTSIGIYALMGRFSGNRKLSLLASLSFLFTPIVLRYSAVTYTDIPLMLFFLGSIYSIYIANNSHGQMAWILPTLIIGMFIGMKITCILYLPVFILLFAFWSKIQRKEIVLFILCTTILASVWYLRNYVIDGDPIPPTINMTRGLKDIGWTKTDYELMRCDLHIPGKNNIIKLPLLLLNSSINSPLRDWPMFYFGFFIFTLPLIAFYYFKKREFIIWGGASFAFFVWIGTSYLIRYCYFLPFILIGSILIIQRGMQTINSKNYFIKLLYRVLLLTICFGTTLSNYKLLFGYINKKIPLNSVSSADFATYGYPDLLLSITNPPKNYLIAQDRIYLYNLTQFKYYFTKEKFDVIGDVVNEGRFSDFRRFLKKDSLYTYLNTLKINDLYIMDDDSLLQDAQSKANWEHFLSTPKVFKTQFNNFKIITIKQ